MEILKNVKYDEKGLVPVIIQDYKTNAVLMMAYMNQESLEKTIDTERTWFYSRSRQKLWNKGESSGNIQNVKSIYYDCDGDTILINVEQVGVACHTGEYSCFYNKITDKNETTDVSVVKKVFKLIEDRKNNPVEGSYTNYLFNEGLDKILKKIGEESSEVIIGAKNRDKTEVTYEVSDLVYHTLVLLIEMDMSIEDIEKELEKRYK